MKINLLIIILFTVTLAYCESRYEAKKAPTTNLYDELIHSDDKTCEKDKLKIIFILSELGKFRIPENAPFTDEDGEKIKKLVKQLKEKEDRIAFAKITMALRRHTSGEMECLHSKLIPVFDWAFWDVIELLAEDRSEKNLQRMETLKTELNIDGGDSYNWSTIVYKIPAP